MFLHSKKLSYTSNSLVCNSIIVATGGRECREFPCLWGKNLIHSSHVRDHSKAEEPMATEKKQNYGNDSISALKGADRVRKRPG